MREDSGCAIARHQVFTSAGACVDRINANETRASLRFKSAGLALKDEDKSHPSVTCERLVTPVPSLTDSLITTTTTST